VIDSPTALLVLGLGNTLCGDDGAGVAAIYALLADSELPDDVRVLDGGTLGLTLLPWLRSARKVILVDAIAADAAPGTLVRLEGADVAHAAVHRLSVHQIGVADLLDGNRWLGGGPEQLVLWGVVPESMELTVDLTPAVAAALPDLVAQVVSEARSLGFILGRR
jgi:hydrogenase maturation protease